MAKNIEAKVKKMLEKNITLHSIRQGYGVFNITSFNKIARQVCRLFPKTPDNPGGHKPKPSESRLLSDEEIEDIMSHNSAHSIYVQARIVAKAQRDLTTSIIRQECADEKVAFAGSVYDEAICMARVECQQRVEGIKRKIEERLLWGIVGRREDEPSFIMSFEDWEALWKEEGI